MPGQSAQEMGAPDVMRSNGRMGFKIPHDTAEFVAPPAGIAKDHAEDRLAGPIGDHDPPAIPLGRGEGAVPIKILEGVSNVADHIALGRQIDSCLVIDHFYI